MALCPNRLHPPARDSVIFRIPHGRLTQNVLQTLKAEGYVNFQDPVAGARSNDGSHQGSRLQRFYGTLLGGIAYMGPATGSLQTRYQDVPIAAGFVDVHAEIVPVPGNGRPTDPRFKTVGSLRTLAVEKGIHVAHKLLQGDALDG